MSGGHWEYENDNACSQIFAWDINPVYGLGQKNHQINSTIAMQLNPMEDVEISDLVYDVFCLLHSYDWYRSGDNMEETYRKDVEYFKEKWFKSSRAERMKKYIDSAVSELRQNLLQIIGEQDAG